MTNIKFDKDRICRFFKGEGTGEDGRYISKIFCDSSADNELEQLLKKQWYEMVREDPIDEKNLDHILYRINYDINNSRVESGSGIASLVKWASRIAAAIIIPLAIYSGIYFYRAQKKANLTWIEVKAPAWAMIQFTLPDSTTGWLNSNSSIRYNGNYSRDRMVLLKGEAYFDVSADKDNPFIVDANEILVKALGTRFNVASYVDENNLEVVLEEGELIINTRELTRSVQVVPDELVTYNKKQDKFIAEYVQPKAYVSWKEGKLVFRNDPIDVIARRLGRWYNVDIDIKGDNFDQLRLRATFIDENLEEVLYYLKRSLPIDYKIIEGGIKADNTYSKKKVEITLE